MLKYGMLDREAALGIVAESAGIGLWELTAENDERIIRMDGLAASVFGLTKKEREMDFFKLVDSFHGDDKAEIITGIQKLVSRPGTKKVMEFRVWSRAGKRWRWVKFAGKSFAPETPGKVYIIGSVQDIMDSPDARELSALLSDASERAKSFADELLRVEEELRQTKEEAEENTSSKSEFLANMSHELRTPMNAIKGLAELLTLTTLNSMQLGYVHNIVKSSNSLLSIINDVLDFSRINANKVELVAGAYPVSDLVSEISNVISLRASEKGLLLLVEISPSVPKALIGDDVRVKQVMINILSNAVKYTHEGHVLLRLSGEETDSGFELVFSVEDTGIGIKKEEIPFLFKAFTQADRRVTKNIQGTGLGLTISNQLVQSMGGSISVESEIGKGSVFTVRFPQRVHDCRPIAAVDSPAEKRVLLMERDVRARCAARMLGELGVDCTVAKGEDCHVELSEERYTHCIYDDSFSEASIRRVRKNQPDCLFIALKDMRYAMGRSEHNDPVLFAPLLITELVKALENAPGQLGKKDAEDSIGDFVLSDTHVLVVDDNEINLLVSGEILRAYKAKVTCAESGQKAIELCDGQKFDIIFMDHMMPGMDGIETTIALREGSGLNKATPIAALTANVVSDPESLYIKSGMDDYLTKPIDIETLNRILREWLPAEKITTMQAALCQETPSPEKPLENSMDRLIKSLDTFGMYVSDVMREIDNDFDLYIRRMDRVRTDLSPLVLLLRDEVRKESWEEFARDIGEMGSMIHDVGARDCSGRARKLSYAAKEGNADYIRGDFYSLMDNMYMLEKKMEVAVPLALGTLSPDVPFGDISYCFDRLKDMEGPLQTQDYETCAALLDSMAHYSLDHALDMILVALGAKLNERDFSAAAALRNEAAEHCAQFL